MFVYGDGGYSVLRRPFVRPSTRLSVTFLFLLLISLNHLSDGSHYLAGRKLPNKHCVLTLLVLVILQLVAQYSLLVFIVVIKLKSSIFGWIV